MIEHTPRPEREARLDALTQELARPYSVEAEIETMASLYYDRIDRHLRTVETSRRPVHRELLEITSMDPAITYAAKDMALKQLLEERDLLDAYYSSPGYSPHSPKRQQNYPELAGIWCVEVTPPGQKIRIACRYTPGEQGWIYQVFAINRKHRQPPFPPPAITR